MKELFKKHDWENWSSLYLEGSPEEREELFRDTVTFLFGYVQTLNDYISSELLKKADLREDPSVDEDFKQQHLKYIAHLRKQKDIATDMLDNFLFNITLHFIFKPTSRHIAEIAEVVVECYNHANTMGWYKAKPEQLDLVDWIEYENNKEKKDE